MPSDGVGLAGLRSLRDPCHSNLLLIWFHYNALWLDLEGSPSQATSRWQSSRFSGLCNCHQ
jgi:hypothetical protein